MKLTKKIGIMIAMMLSVGMCGCNNMTQTGTTQSTKTVETESGSHGGNITENVAEAGGYGTTWPERAVSIVVGANPGGGQDSLARLYAKYLTEATGQAFNVVNVTGGSGSIASTQVKDAEADGYSMLLMHEGLLNNKVTGVTDYGADAFEFVGIDTISRSVGLVCNGNNFKNIEEIADYAKANPGAVVAATEWGGTTHQALLSLAKGLGIEISIVDGGSVGERISGIVGGIYDMTITPLGNVADYITSGSMIPILMFNDEVYEEYKDIPIGSEYNVDYVFEKFFACYFPKGTDQSIVLKCRAMLKEISQKPEFQEAVQKMDLVIADEYIDDVSVSNSISERLRKYNEEYPVE